MFQKPSCIKSPFQQNFVYEWSLGSTPNRQSFTLHIVGEATYAWRKSYGFVGTEEFDFLRYGRDHLYDGLCCADGLHPVLAFLRPFNWQNVFSVTPYSHRLRIIRESWALCEPLLQNGCSWDAVLTTYGPRWMQVRLRLKFVHRSDQALLPSLVTLFSTLCFDAKALHLEVHDIDKHLFYFRARGHFCGRSYTEKIQKGKCCWFCRVSGYSHITHSNGPIRSFRKT